MAEPAEWLVRQPFAHRGLHGGALPENSPGAFRAAIDRGFGIECDIRVSAEGRAIVFHDAGLDRLTGHEGRVEHTTVGQLTAIRLTGSEETIPTLRDVLQTVAGRVPLLLELKTDRKRNIHKLCRAVRRDLVGYVGEVAVMSFDPRVGAWFAKRVRDLPRGLVVTEEDARTLTGAIKRRLAFWKAKPQFLAYDIRDLPSRFAASHTSADVPLLSWTVKTAAHCDTAREAGATPIMEGPGVAAWEQAS